MNKLLVGIIILFALSAYVLGFVAIIENGPDKVKTLENIAILQGVTAFFAVGIFALVNL